MTQRGGAAVQRRKGAEPRPRAAAKEEGGTAAASRDGSGSGMTKRIVVEVEGRGLPPSQGRVR